MCTLANFLTQSWSLKPQTTTTVILAVATSSQMGLLTEQGSLINSNHNVSHYLNIRFRGHTCGLIAILA